MLATAPLLELVNLEVHFPTPHGPARAVDGLSFAIQPGEMLGLVGESGCGKSVTALAVMGLLPRRRAHVSGRALWQGRDLLALPAAEMRRLRGRELAMVFQDPQTSLNPVFSVGEQLVETFARHLGLTRREARIRAAAALGEVGIDRSEERLRAYPGQLSGGMRQRVMIAMAMAARPKLLIADEPTTALDVTTQAQVLRLLDEQRRSSDAALLLITHDLGLVAESCERVVVLYAGKAAELAPTRRLFDEPLHPYTQGLLRAVRKLAEGGVEAAIPGRVEPAHAYPPGCRFHPRCPFAMDRCRIEIPPLFMREETHVACWLHA
jgi:oligopeptide/dipeptide ABC transporter ATP-binding protein